jgi:hypothetical protein
MVMLRALAKTTAVASSAHGSSGAEIEKNTVIMSRTKTVPKLPSILVRSRSLSWSRRPGRRCMSLTARTCAMWDQEVREPCNDERDDGDDQHGYYHLATLPVNPTRSEGMPRSWVIAGRFNESSRGSAPVTTNGIEVARTIMRIENVHLGCACASDVMLFFLGPSRMRSCRYATWRSVMATRCQDHDFKLRRRIHCSCSLSSSGVGVLSLKASKNASSDTTPSTAAAACIPVFRASV